ncbi:MAG: cell division protein ZapB [Thermoanaerobaculia bacterium]|nr:cell division protein ZapB [Thermoanaerobaculia bacterium]
MKETKGRSEGKAASEASLDEVLDTIESRLESLVEVMKALGGENTRLKAELASAREAAEKNIGGAAAALAKHEADRAAVRARIERLLKTLEETNQAGRPV